MMSTSTRGRHGFTLIELLVVIAIIAILAAILFPVFVRARESAKLTNCIATIKQLGVAVSNYYSDWDGCFPWAPFYMPSKPHTSDNVGGWPVSQYVGGDSGLESVYNSGVPLARERPLFRYTKNMTMWKCPSEPKFDRGSGIFETDYKWFGTSYPMNAVWEVSGAGLPATLSAVNVIKPTGGLAIQWGRKFASVRKPTRMILFGDRAIHAYFAEPHTIEGAYPGESSAQAALHRFRNHDKDKPRSPVVFCDGHTGYVLMTPDHEVTHGGRKISTKGLWDEQQGWALMESGWIPHLLDVGSPL